MGTIASPTIHSISSSFSGDSSGASGADMDRRRKREDDGGAGVGKKRPKGPESAAGGEQAAAAAATDEEVEEFFAILRRIHAAVRYFEKGKRGEGSRRLTLSELEALPEEEGEEDDGAPRRSDDPGLDLNCEPSSEADAASGL